MESAVEIWVDAAFNLSSLTYPIHFAKLYASAPGLDDNIRIEGEITRTNYHMAGLYNGWILQCRRRAS